jgi:hypothetical protein
LPLAEGVIQHSLLSDNLADLREWEPKIRQAFAALPELADVNSDFVLIQRLVDGGDLPLAEGVIQQRIGRRHVDAEAAIG